MEMKRKKSYSEVAQFNLIVGKEPTSKRFTYLKPSYGRETKTKHRIFSPFSQKASQLEPATLWLQQ